jgi:hypothetical protein
MTQATYTGPGNPTDPADAALGADRRLSEQILHASAREISQEFTAMLQAKRASRACRVKFVGFLGRQLLSTGPKGLLSSMRVCTSPLIIGVCPVK